MTKKLVAPKGKSLRRKILAGASADADRGFQLLDFKSQHFSNQSPFLKAVKEDEDATTAVPTEAFTRLDVDGRVEGTDWRFSRAAFSDLCHFTKTPVTFIKDLAKIDENLALDVVEEMVRARFNHADRNFMLDTRTGQILGVVGAETYSHISHLDVLDAAFTANPKLGFSEGWLSGPEMRCTAVGWESPVVPQKDDLVHLGISLENATHGDRSVRLMDYALRLVCTNGLTAREGAHMALIRHQGDVAFEVQAAALACAERANEMAPRMASAANQLLGLQDIRSIRAYLTDNRNGGSKRLDKAVAKKALQESANEGRDEGEVTLWNVVNGITEVAKETASLQRKTELEALGYRTLARFGAVTAAPSMN